MGNGPQRQPVYDPEELDALNKIFEQAGMPAVDIYGDPLDATSAPIPSVTFEQPAAPEERSIVTQELETLGPAVRGVTRAAEERQAQSDFEQAFNNLVEQRVTEIYQTEAYKTIPELQDLDENSFELSDRIYDYARKETQALAETQLGLVPGFPLEGYAPPGQPMQFPRRMAGGILPAPTPAPPIDLPPAEAPTVASALAPQTRVGPVIAEREEMLSRPKTAEEMIEEQGLDPELHIKAAELERLSQLEQVRDLTPEEQGQIVDLSAATEGKEAFGDITQIAQIKGFEDALNKYYANESVARTQTQREAAQFVLDEIQALGPLLEGEGPANKYKEHIPGTEYDSALASAFASQVRRGRVPIISKVQEDYLRAYRPIIERAYVDVLPYELQLEKAAVAPTTEVLEDEPPDIGEVVPVGQVVSALESRPAPITLQEAKANYDQRLSQALDKDFFAIDFWEDPDKYAQGWSWWNQSYPSGASVEGPGSVLLRWSFAPANVLSRAVYDAVRTADAVTGESVAEPSDVAKIAAGGMDPRYAGHPYLRNIAENRSMMDDLYDLYWYNGNKNFAHLAGGVGLVADMFMVPFDPGITQTAKGLSAAAKSAVIAKSLGMPIRAKDVGSDFARAMFSAYGDSSPALKKVQTDTGFRMLDPSEYGATRAADFMAGANAYRAAFDDALEARVEILAPEGTVRQRPVTYTAPNGEQFDAVIAEDISFRQLDMDDPIVVEEAHQAALNAAAEALNVGPRGNPFLDFARKKGYEWSDKTVQDLAANTTVGAEAYNRLVDDIWRYMSFRDQKLPKQARKLVDAYEAVHGEVDVSVLDEEGFEAFFNQLKQFQDINQPTDEQIEEHIQTLIQYAETAPDFNYRGKKLTPTLKVDQREPYFYTVPGREQGDHLYATDPDIRFAQPTVLKHGPPEIMSAAEKKQQFIDEIRKLYSADNWRRTISSEKQLAAQDIEEYIRATREVATLKRDPADVILGAKLRKIYDEAGAGGFARLLEPLNYKTSQSAIVTALDANPLTRGSWRNLRQVTESLLMTPAKIKEFAKVAGRDSVLGTLTSIQQKSKLLNGLHKNVDARLRLDQASNFNPKVGSFYAVDQQSRDELISIIDDLAESGFITRAEQKALRNPLEVDFNARKPLVPDPEDEALEGLTDEQVDELFESIDDQNEIINKQNEAADILAQQFGGTQEGLGYVISTDNMRRVISAQLEKIAFDNKFGVGIEAFEQAATVTKKALLEPIEARYLAASWPKRVFSKLFGAVGDKSKWSELYQEGAPIYVVRALDKLRGRLSTMNITLRRDIREVMTDENIQKAYFTEEWLADNEVTRNDAIIALALGPRAMRVANMATMAHNITNILIAKSSDVSLDVMDAFRRASVQRANIADSLSYDGKQRLQEIVDSLQDVQDYKTWTMMMEDFYDELKTFINTPENFVDPTAKIQLAAPDFASVTAGFYYLQQQKRLVDEAVNDIALNTPGLDAAISTSSVLSDEALMRSVFDQMDDLGFNARYFPYDLIIRPAIAKRMGQLLLDRASPSLAEDLITSNLREDYLTVLRETRTTKNVQLMYDTIDRKYKSVAELFESPRDVFGIMQLGLDDAIPAPLQKVLGRKTIREFLNVGNPMEEAMVGVPVDPFENLFNFVRRKQTLRGPLLDALNLLQLKIQRERKFKNVFMMDVAQEDEIINLIRIHEAITEVAETIIRQNNLNSTTINQNLSLMDDIFKSIKDKVLGEPGQTRQFTAEVIASSLEKVDEFDLADLLSDYMVGIKVSDEIEKTVNSATQVRQIREALNGLFEQNTTSAYKVVKAIDTALTWLTRARYQTILAGRPAFHAVNVLTAPFLVWGTLGGRAAIDSVKHSKKAVEVLIAGPEAIEKRLGLPPFLRKGGVPTPKSYQLAVTDPFGRQYTYRDVYDLALGQGALRSRTAITLSPSQYQEMLDDARFDPQYSSYVKRGMSRILDLGGAQAAVGAVAGLPSPTIAGGTAFQGVMALPGVRRTGQQLSPKATKAAQFLADLTEWEDQIFRLATVIGALERGTDPAQALATGRRALYDYGSLSQPEKWAMTRFAMFYSFWRLNLGNTLGLMFSDPKRLVNIYRATTAGERSLRALGGDDNMQFKTHELEFYQHSFLLSRPVIKYVEGIDRNTYYEVLPGVPVLDAMTTIAQIMFAPTPSAAMEPFRGFLDPTVRAVTGMEQTMVWRKKYVDPKDMYIMDKTAWGDVFWDSIIGERPQGRPARSGEEAWNGQQWSLSPAAFERYLTFKNQIAPFLAVPNVYTGSTLPFSLMISGGDPELTGRRFPDGRPEPLSVLGIVRDVGGIPISEQRRRQLREMARRLQALEKQKTRR